MSDNERDPMLILKARLASGEIDADKYRELMAVLRYDEPLAKDARVKPRTATTQDRLIAQVDNVSLYEKYIVVDGERHPLAEVVSVSAWGSSMSVNFIPMDKTTSVSFTLFSGLEVHLKEERTLFGRARHNAIATLGAALKKLTFQARLDRLAETLRREHRVQIFQPLFKDGESIYLTLEGTLEAPSRSVNLKRARSHGVMGVGVESTSLGLNRGHNTEEIVASEEKGMMGYVPKSALQFVVNAKDTDVTNSLIVWLSQPENHLLEINADK